MCLLIKYSAHMKYSWFLPGWRGAWIMDNCHAGRACSVCAKGPIPTWWGSFRDQCSIYACNLLQMHHTTQWWWYCYLMFVCFWSVFICLFVFNCIGFWFLIWFYSTIRPTCILTGHCMIQRLQCQFSKASLKHQRKPSATNNEKHLKNVFGVLLLTYVD